MEDLKCPTCNGVQKLVPSNVYTLVDGNKLFAAELTEESDCWVANFHITKPGTARELYNGDGFFIGFFNQRDVRPHDVITVRFNGICGACMGTGCFDVYARRRMGVLHA